MVIREIRQEDNASIEAIMRACFKEFNLPILGSSLEDEEVTGMFEGYQSTRSVYFVIEENGEVLGGAGIKQLSGCGEEVCELQKMYLHPKIRGKGYGRLLFDSCIAYARDFNYKTCYLESASQLKSAISLYEKNGFQHLEHPMGNTGHVVCGVWMAKKL